MLIGINGRFFPGNWRPALEEIAFAAAAGFQAMQFPGKAEGLKADHLGAELATVNAALRTAALVAVMEMLVRVDEDGKTEEGLTPLDVLAANLPAITQLPCVCAHWHLVLPEETPHSKVEALERGLASQLVEGVGLAARHGFRLGIEHNEPDRAPFGLPEACALALDAAPGLGFVWDFNHTRPDHLAAFQALIPRVSMVHVSDTRLPAVNEHLPLGLGNVDLAGYCHALRVGGFNGPAILEIGGLPKSGGYGRDTDAALVESLARLRAASEETENRQD